MPIVDTIASQFGINCEVVLHDLSMPQTSLVAISGEITKRALGAPITNYVIDLLKKHGDGVLDSYIYPSTTKDGKNLKSSTTFIRDRKKHIIGCLCINYCLDNISAAIHSLEELMAITESANATKEEYTNDINEMVGNIIETALGKVNKPIAQMERSEKINFVKELDARGLFLVKGSVEMVAAKLDISKYTLYTYIDEIKKA